MAAIGTRHGTYLYQWHQTSTHRIIFGSISNLQTTPTLDNQHTCNSYDATLAPRQESPLDDFMILVENESFGHPHPIKLLPTAPVCGDFLVPSAWLASHLMLSTRCFLPYGCRSVMSLSYSRRNQLSLIENLHELRLHEPSVPPSYPPFSPSAAYAISLVLGCSFTSKYFQLGRMVIIFLPLFSPPCCEFPQCSPFPVESPQSCPNVCCRLYSIYMGLMLRMPAIFILVPNVPLY